ncbi:hypothetical protein GCM10011574_27710 [Microbispora bryophytorum]|uniref:Uncharacterized protein n=1 Tax=Microbispora bryophytorum TaxID=1460882 RepID=A0A8H9LA38_9ACTN|nr:hypothetical protein GCM10011574_27710 [Microbispora bryophytorum]
MGRTGGLSTGLRPDGGATRFAAGFGRPARAVTSLRPGAPENLTRSPDLPNAGPGPSAEERSRAARNAWERPPADGPDSPEHTPNAGAAGDDVLRSGRIGRSACPLLTGRRRDIVIPDFVTAPSSPAHGPGRDRDLHYGGFLGLPRDQLWTIT